MRVEDKKRGPPLSSLSLTTAPRVEAIRSPSAPSESSTQPDSHLEPPASSRQYRCPNPSCKKGILSVASGFKHHSTCCAGLPFPTPDEVLSYNRNKKNKNAERKKARDEEESKNLLLEAEKKKKLQLEQEEMRAKQLKAEKQEKISALRKRMLVSASMARGNNSREFLGQLPRVGSEVLSDFKLYVMSKFGLNKDKNAANTILLCVSRILKFENKDVADVDIAADIDSHLSNTDRLTAFFTLLDANRNISGNTKKTHLKSLLDLIQYRQLQLGAGNPVYPGLLDAHNRLQKAMPAFSNDQAARARERMKTEAELKAERRWVEPRNFFEVLPTAVDDFKLLVSAVEGHSELDKQQQLHALSVILGAYHAYHRPVRAGVLSQIAIKDWSVIKERGYYLTSRFKTAKAFKFQAVQFCPAVVELIDIWLRCMRRPTSDEDLLFCLPHLRQPPVNRAIQFFCEFYLRQEGITLTLLRGIATTIVNARATLDEARVYATSDTHSFLTAEKHYDKDGALRTAKEADRIFHRVQGTSDAASAASLLGPPPSSPVNGLLTTTFPNPAAGPAHPSSSPAASFFTRIPPAPPASSFLADAAPATPRADLSGRLSQLSAFSPSSGSSNMAKRGVRLEPAQSPSPAASVPSSDTDSLFDQLPRPISSSGILGAPSSSPSPRSTISKPGRAVITKRAPRRSASPSSSDSDTGEDTDSKVQSKSLGTRIKFSAEERKMVDAYGDRLGPSLASKAKSWHDWCERRKEQGKLNPKRDAKSCADRYRQSIMERERQELQEMEASDEERWGSENPPSKKRKSGKKEAKKQSKRRKHRDRE